MKARTSADTGRLDPVAPAFSLNARGSAVVSPAVGRAVVPAALLRTIVFFGGLSSIGAELTVSRLIAPYFGSSTFIWATIIGITLAFLSLGYWIGGRLADRRPSARVLFAITAVAAIAIGLVPILARPILGSSLVAFQNLDVGAFYGALVGTLLLLAVPVTLLGFVTPYVIRLRMHDVRSAGETAGSIYALSTAGSIAGSFLPVLIFIPILGTARTFLVLALLLIVPSLVGLALTRAVLPASMVAVTLVLLPFAARAADPGGIRPPDRGTLVHERESTYNYIQVVDDDGAAKLILNDGHAVHSIYDPDRLLTGGPWDYFMAGPLVIEAAGPETVQRAIFIGLAGGTGVRQLSAAYGPIAVDGVEIDPEIVEVGRQYFGLDEMPNLNVIVADGRYALRTSDETYDLIAVDAYRQPYIPFQLASREFFDEASAKLTEDGVVVVNVGRTQTDFRLVDTLAATMRASFDHVYAIDVGRYLNTILIGTNAPSSLANIEPNATKFAADSPIREVARWIGETGNGRVVQPGGEVFTDDRAPVERVVDGIILDAARDVTGR
ncbi:MAG: Spermidine synthase-like protein [uncultured Thermomicrobiales bacterium]|uniref:Spermidine synthase-like protein n=1 Tax=uncultured Thermomicrobiales bacterium TaxID=1645740 RepID=A0A6J4V1Z2_9BACT|nr:MAG: Spermidine synthase-like protein [uncultured Thermomicrobiales bacterium]